MGEEKKREKKSLNSICLLVRCKTYYKCDCASGVSSTLASTRTGSIKIGGVHCNVKHQSSGHYVRWGKAQESSGLHVPTWTAVHDPVYSFTRILRLGCFLPASSSMALGIKFYENAFHAITKCRAILQRLVLY